MGVVGGGKPKKGTKPMGEVVPPPNFNCFWFGGGVRGFGVGLGGFVLADSGAVFVMRTGVVSTQGEPGKGGKRGEPNGNVQRNPVEGGDKLRGTGTKYPTVHTAQPKSKSHENMWPEKREVGGIPL